MKILIGYDGSESADAMLTDLKKAGLPLDTEAVVAAVDDLQMVEPLVQEDFVPVVPSQRIASAIEKAQTQADKAIKETKELAEKGRKRVQDIFPDWRVRSEVFAGTPGWVLIDVADKLKTDLIFVGSQGRSAIGRLILGSVSKRIATDARCSVRISRSNMQETSDEMNTPPRIIVGVDGSPAAEQAIYSIGQRVWNAGTEVRLVAVNDILPTTNISVRLPRASAMINSYLRTREERVTEMLEWGTKELNHIGLKTSILRKNGGPQKILVDEAKKWNADSIFVGTRDFNNAFERFRLGSVSTYVLTNAHCSVEVVRPPESIQE